jgi:hypothetical protein
MAAAMADALKLQFIIEAVDQARGVATGIAGSVRSVARDIVGSFGGVNSAMQGFSRSYAGIATAIGGGLEIRDLIGNEDTFNRLRVNYGLTEEAIGALHETIVTAADDAKVKLGDMLGALEGFREAGGDVAKFGGDAKTAAAAVQLLGGQGDAVGQMIAGLRRQLGITEVEDMTRAIATLYEQTKMVPGGFAQLAPQLNPLVTQYAALGHTGTQAAREIGAVYAVIADGAKSGRQAAAEMQNLLGTLATAEGRAHIGAALGDFGKVSAGGDILDPRKVLPLTDIVRSIADAYQRDPTRMALMLGPQLANDLKTLIAQPGLLDQKLGASGDPRKFFDDAAEAAKSLSASINQLKTSIDQVGESWLATPFRVLAGVINFAHGALAALIFGLGGLSILGNVVPWFKAGFMASMEFAGSIAVLSRALGASFVLNLGVIAERLGFVATGFLDIAAAIEATPIAVILGGIAAVATAIYSVVYLLTHAKELADALKTPDGGSINPWAQQYVSPSGVPQTSSWDDWKRAMLGGSSEPPRAGLAPPRPGMGDRAPAFGGASPSATANNQVNGQVVVTFENAPANLMPKKAQSDNPHVDLDVDMGYNMTAVP